MAPSNRNSAGSDELSAQMPSSNEPARARTRETRSAANAMALAGKLTAVAMSAAGVAAIHADPAAARPVCADIGMECPTSPTVTVSPDDSAPDDSDDPSGDSSGSPADDAPPSGHPTRRSAEDSGSDPEPADDSGQDGPADDGPGTDVGLPGTSTRPKRGGARKPPRDSEPSGGSDQADPPRRPTRRIEPGAGETGSPETGNGSGVPTGENAPGGLPDGNGSNGDDTSDDDTSGDTAPTSGSTPAGRDDSSGYPGPTSDSGGDSDDSDDDLRQLLTAPLEADNPPSDTDGRTAPIGGPLDLPTDDGPAPVTDDGGEGDSGDADSGDTDDSDDDLRQLLTAPLEADNPPADSGPRDERGSGSPADDVPVLGADPDSQAGEPGRSRSGTATDPDPDSGGSDDDDGSDDLRQLLVGPLENDGQPSGDDEPSGDGDPTTLYPVSTPAQTRRQLLRQAKRLKDQDGDNPWIDLYVQNLTAGSKPVRPEPAPRSLRDMDPAERDDMILDPLSAPLFSAGEREGARRRKELRDINKQRKVVRGQLRDEIEGDGLPGLLVGPLGLDAKDVDDPVLRDTLCLSGSVTGCRPKQALTRLELDLLRESGDLPRSQDPDPTRRDSDWFKNRETDHRKAAEKALRKLQREQQEAQNPDSPDFSWGGLLKGTLKHGKGIAVSSYKRSPLGLMTNPQDFAEENVEMVKGAGEGVKGIWDTGVMLWQLSPQGCSVDPDACAKRQVEMAELVEYAKAHPKAFAKNAGLAIINYEDLADGDYSEWAGNFAPDVLIAALTYGSGSAANGGLRGLKALKALDDLPAPARTKALLKALGPGAGGRLDLSPGSLDRLTQMLVRSSSGAGRKTRRYLPTRTSGAAAELKVLGDYGRRRGVRRLYSVAESNKKNQRTPDFVSEGRGGRLQRVESTIVTVGRGSGYKGKGKVRNAPLTTDAVTGAIRRKIGGDVTQFNAPLRLADGRDVPEGGTLSLHLRRPAGASSRADFDAAGRQTLDTARQAIAKSSRDLLDAKVKTVEVNLGGTTIRYRIRPNGDPVPQRIKHRRR